MHNDLNALIEYGSPPVEEICEAWSNIYAEWIDINESNDALYAIDLQKHIALLKINIEECETSIHFLNTHYDARLVKILQDNKISIDLLPEQNELYYLELEKADNQLSKLRFDLETKSREYDLFISSREKQTIESNYFEKWLSAIARFRHIAVIKKTDITVLEFVMMLTDYMNYYKSQTTIQNTPSDGQ